MTKFADVYGSEKITSSFHRLHRSALELGEGMTIMLYGSPIPDTGFVVGLLDFELTLNVEQAPYFAGEVLSRLTLNPSSPNVSKFTLGVWLKGSSSVYNLGVVVDDLDEALKIAKVHDQYSIWSLSESREIISNP